jgi:hypothetical protein
VYYRGGFLFHVFTAVPLITLFEKKVISGISGNIKGSSIVPVGELSENNYFWL